MGILGLDNLLERDTRTTDGDPIHAHIIDRGSDERPASAIILEARVNGTPLTALCGYVWIPSRDPEKYPVCPKCEEIVGFAKDMYGITGNIDGVDG